MKKEVFDERVKKAAVDMYSPKSWGHNYAFCKGAQWAQENPLWHELTNNADDLPEPGIAVWAYTEDGTYLKAVCNSDGIWDCGKAVIAWIELPYYNRV